MRVLFCILFSIIPAVCFSQDVIILRNGQKIDCKITKVGETTVYYDFFKGDRKLSSYEQKSNIRSYYINETGKPDEKTITDSAFAGNEVMIDSVKYSKKTNKWINLITYTKKYGLHATGWTVQYYGFLSKSTSRWAVPVIIGYESFEIDYEYFAQSDLYSASMNYGLIGANPFYRLNDYFFLNLGFNAIIGTEKRTNFYEKEETSTVFGFYPSQGIYIIPKSKFGLTVGIGIYEKVLTSEFFKNDIGINLEIGIKF